MEKIDTIWGLPYLDGESRFEIPQEKCLVRPAEIICEKGKWFITCDCFICQTLSLTFKGDGSEFWHFWGFERLNWWWWYISEEDIWKIYPSFRDFSITSTNHMVNRGWTRVSRIFQLNKDPTAHIGKFWENLGNCLKFGSTTWIFYFSPDPRNQVECDEKQPFRWLISL